MTLLMGVGNIGPLLPVVLIVLIFVVGVGLIARSAFKMIRQGKRQT